MYFLVTELKPHQTKPDAPISANGEYAELQVCKYQRDIADTGLEGTRVCSVRSKLGWTISELFNLGIHSGYSHIVVFYVAQSPR